jgi:hypothetical protein
MGGYTYELLRHYTSNDAVHAWASMVNKQSYKAYCQNPPTNKHGELIAHQPIFLVKEREL